VKWSKEAARQLEVTPFMVNSSLHVATPSFRTLIYAVCWPPLLQ